MKKLFLIALITFINNINLNAAMNAERLPLIPYPAHVELTVGQFIINTETQITFSDTSFARDIEIFQNYLGKYYALKIGSQQTSSRKKNSIIINSDNTKVEDGYSLTINNDQIIISSGQGAGVFYAFQTIIQLLPPGKTTLTIPACVIEDSPRFSWRGMHLDVARHFFPVNVVKRYIDHLAMYKMNVFHWHLSDDQGWRIEIKKYPKLQTVSAWRSGTLKGHLGDKPEVYDSIRYGGFYTQKEIIDVVEYARQRHITVVPEIELPGHALAALAAYPELSCSGGPFETGKTWGVFKDVFCPKEETFNFLEDVFDEVCTLFPGKYIHIGGDECPKDSWKNCPHCQELIRKGNLRDENDLQGYFTKRIVNYLKTKNKIAVGWDEILEEGLDSSAIVMSWRGVRGGADAAAKNHYAVMAPSTHVYFDMYQSRFTGGRLAIGGYLPIDQVYRFEPVPDVLSSEQSKYILGAQGNLWTEYITDEQRLEEMLFPRIGALAEVVWSPKEKRDYAKFTSRAVINFKLLSFLKIKYSTALYEISSHVFPNGSNGISIELFTNYPNGNIYYTFTGKEPDLSSEKYTSKIVVDQSVVIRASLFEGGQRKGDVFTESYEVNLATGKEIILANPPHIEYSRGGAMALVNGATGKLPWIPSEWLGFEGKNLDATIDLGDAKTFSRVTVDVLKDEQGRIYLPSQVKISTSNDGTSFKEIASLDTAAINKSKRGLQVNFPKVTARYMKVVAVNQSAKDWLFVDEIRVE